MKKITTVLTVLLFSAAAAQTDTIKEKIDRARLELQQQQGPVNGTPPIHNSTIEVPTKLDNGIETRNTVGNVVQQPPKGANTTSPRQPTTNEINAREAAKINAKVANPLGTTPPATRTTTTVTTPTTDTTRVTTPSKAKASKKRSTKRTTR